MSGVLLVTEPPSQVESSSESHKSDSRKGDPANRSKERGNQQRSTNRPESVHDTSCGITALKGPHRSHSKADRCSRPSEEGAASGANSHGFCRSENCPGTIDDSASCFTNAPKNQRHGHPWIRILSTGNSGKHPGAEEQSSA